MSGKSTEACGRCSVTSVVDMADERDPYGPNRIEVDESELRRLSMHHVAATRLKAWFDSVGQRLIYGR